jgi:hypothetical protein
MSSVGNGNGPGMTIVSPPSWSAHEVVELAAPDLSAHVIVSVEAVGMGTTLDELARDYATLLEKVLPDYSEVSMEPITLPDERDAVLRMLRWTPPGGQEVTQLQLYSIEGDRACVGTATAQSAAFDRLQPDLRRALESMQPGAAPGIEIPAVQGSPDGVVRPDGSEQIVVPLAAGSETSAAMPERAWASIRERFGGERS